MRYLSFLIGFLIAGSAFAQQIMPQQQQSHPVEQTLVQEWSAYQISEQHVSAAILKLVEEWRKDRQVMAAERQYWTDYVKGLYGEKPQSMVNPK